MERDSKTEVYSRILSGLRENIDAADFTNLELLTSKDSVSSMDEFVVGQGADPNTCRNFAIGALRSEFRLDYDDLVFSEDYVGSIPATIVRNALLAHFVSVSADHEDEHEQRYDATLNSVAGDYLNLAELVLFKIEALTKNSEYVLNPEDAPVIMTYLASIKNLISYSWHMLDMHSMLKPATFKKKCFRMRSHLNAIIEMATFKRPCPDVESLKNEISDTVDRIMKDTDLDNLQSARNEMYKQSKIRLYNYTIRMAEQLNIQLEACNPLDITHRADLKKQLETVQRFRRSFDKDR